MRTIIKSEQETMATPDHKGETKECGSNIDFQKGRSKQRFE